MCNFSETTSVGEKNKRRKRLAKKKRSPIFFCWHAAWVCPCTAGHQGQGMQMRLCGRLSCKTCASWPLAIHPIWFCQDLDKKHGFKIFFRCQGSLLSLRFNYKLGSYTRWHIINTNALIGLDILFSLSSVINFTPSPSPRLTPKTPVQVGLMWKHYWG